MAITKEKADWNPQTQQRDIKEVVTTYVGRVIRVHQRDYRAMSDVYTLATFATVVDDAGEVKEVLVNANFECDDSRGRAVVDATPEVLAIKATHDKKIADETERLNQAVLEERKAKELNRPVPGKKMEVVKGRKVPIGTVGTVAYVSGSGNVLLKADDAWQDRKAQGTWVSSTNLKARV